ncbi:MAG TPA: zf-HC2 domain-containing protein [Thermoanaerobaculia bacterium]|jgi:anti-sigma factor RsiW|nr:zf-HC2 domain-containing protein [Thermoanaerobaculia bacterium]
MKDTMAERYILGELPPETRDAFEEHFFGCPQCAAAVRDESVLMDSGRELMRNPVPVPIHRSRSVWRAAAVAAVAVFVLTLQRPWKPTPPARPVIVNSGDAVVVQLAEVRGPEGLKVVDVKPGQDIILRYVVFPGEDFAAYRVEVRDQAGRVLYARAGADAKALMTMRIPAGTLPAGEYNVVVSGEPRGGATEEIASPRFRVRFH